MLCLVCMSLRSWCVRAVWRACSPYTRGSFECTHGGRFERTHGERGGGGGGGERGAGRRAQRQTPTPTHTQTPMHCTPILPKFAHVRS